MLNLLRFGKGGYFPSHINLWDTVILVKFANQHFHVNLIKSHQFPCNHALDMALDGKREWTHGQTTPNQISIGPVSGDNKHNTAATTIFIENIARNKQICTNKQFLVSHNVLQICH